MLISIPRSSPIICIWYFMFRFGSASQPVCYAGLYVIPDYRDCLSAWHSMPFAMAPSCSDDAKRYQLYTEPQYLLPPFTDVINRYKPRSINQLPKIWRYSKLMRPFSPRDFTSKVLISRRCCNPLTKCFPDTCRIALMSYGRPNRSVMNPLWSTSWRTILDQVQILFACGSPPRGIDPSGGYMAFTSIRAQFHSNCYPFLESRCGCWLNSYNLRAKDHRADGSSVYILCILTVRGSSRPLYERWSADCSYYPYGSARWCEQFFLCITYQQHTTDPEYACGLCFPAGYHTLGSLIDGDASSW